MMLMGRKNRHKGSSLQTHDLVSVPGSALLLFTFSVFHKLLWPAVLDVSACQLCHSLTQSYWTAWQVAQPAGLTTELQLSEVVLDLPHPGLLELQG